MAANGVRGSSAEGTHAEDRLAKKRKRNRAVLSCVPCKQRKVKCSRTIPCENCLKRDAAAECRWAEKEFEPPKQVFALDCVMDKLRAHFEGRIEHLETLLKVEASVKSQQVVKEALGEAYSHGSMQGSASAGNNESSMFLEGSESPEPSPSLDEAAGAAFALEVLAGGDNGMDTPSETKPFSQILAPEEFAKTSILATDTNARLEGNARIPLLGFLNRRNITDSILACLQSRENSQKLINYFFRSTGWIYAVIHQRQFQAEHDAFWQHVTAGQREFDLPWLATLCIILAIALQSQKELTLGCISYEDMYQLSKLCLEFAEWRRCPTRRAAQVVFFASVYMNNENDTVTGRLYLYEALACVESMGWHQLGDDFTILPKPDISVQEGSLLARESAVRIFWDIVTQDWIGIVPTRHPVVDAKSFTTCGPRNFTDEQLLFGRWDTQPMPLNVGTQSMIHLGKTQTGYFTHDIYKLGPIPNEDSQLRDYYEKLLKIEKTYKDNMELFFHMKGGPFNAEDDADWRIMVGYSGIGCRLMRAHRPFMVRGYREPNRFGYSTKSCIEGAMQVLTMLRKLEAAKAPFLAVWFLSRHLLAAITTIYIDVLHDADIGAPIETSERKLVDMPWALAWFVRAEGAPGEATREMGKRGRLLIQAMQDAAEARRRTGGGSKQDYGRVLKEIGASVRKSSTMTTPTSATASSSVSPSVPPAATTTTTAPINWLDDPETRKLLSSLGLLDAGGQWQQSSIGNNDDPLNFTTTLDFSNSFNNGFDLLDSYAYRGL